MFTKIYQTSLMFRMATVMLAFFVLVATALPMGYGAVGSAYAAGHDGEPPEEPPEELPDLQQALIPEELPYEQQEWLPEELPD